MPAVAIIGKKQETIGRYVIGTTPPYKVSVLFIFLVA